MAEMRKLTAYFSHIRAGNTWEAMEPAYEDLFHPDVVITGRQTQFDYQGWKRQCQEFLDRGVTFEMEKLVKEEKEKQNSKVVTIIYTVTVHDENGAFRHTAKGIFKDGKMIRTEPADPSIYDRMSKKSRKHVQIL